MAVRFLIISVILLMSGCVEMRAMVATRSAEASDAALDSAMWTLCSASPIGAYKRRFKTPEEIKAVGLLCK